jgi:hypothetical protein
MVTETWAPVTVNIFSEYPWDIIPDTNGHFDRTTASRGPITREHNQPPKYANQNEIKGRMITSPAIETMPPISARKLFM